MIVHILGKIVLVEGFLLLLPFAVSLIYADGCSIVFGALAASLVLVSALVTARAPKNRVIYASESFVIVGLAWVLTSVLGALPFTLSGSIPSFIDAFFETVSGFTTTGASILTNVEILPMSILFWRSFTHWIGGMGVLVFVMAIIPLAGGHSMHLMRAEVPGPTVGKLVSRFQSNAKILYGIYIGISVLQIILLLAGGMPLFDSLVNTFATAGTGGFSIKNTSIAAYNSAYIDGVIGIFMLIFGINFNLFYLLLTRKFLQVLKNEELRCYLAIVALSVGAITLDILSLYENVGEALRYAFFQVSSIITTTGFATDDFNLWPNFSKTVLVILMFFGACAGSTGGGLKISRLVIMAKTVLREIKKTARPRSIISIKMEGKPVEDSVVNSTNTYFVVYMVIILFSVLLISIDEFDLVTNFTAVVTCFNNVGPGLSVVGPTGNFSEFSMLSKLILSFDMLLGRLEIFPILMLFSPSLWRKK